MLANLSRICLSSCWTASSSGASGISETLLSVLLAASGICSKFDAPELLELKINDNSVSIKNSNATVMIFGKLKEFLSGSILL